MDGLFRPARPAQPPSDPYGVEGAGGPLSGDDLAILGEAALILARIQTNPKSDSRAGEIAGLGRVTIQIVLTDAIARIGQARRWS